MEPIVTNATSSDEAKVDAFFAANPKFVEFLTTNKICLTSYKSSLLSYLTSGLRTIRLLSPLPSCSLPPPLSAHPLFPSFLLTLPRERLLSSLPPWLPSFMGMDSSSYLVSSSLGLSPGTTFVELCCCPCVKLSIAAEHTGSKGRVFGVDISSERLRIAQKVLAKTLKKQAHVRLVRADASTVAWHQIAGEGPDAGERADRVLCDVECSHDGSLKHVVKFLEGITQAGEEQHNEARVGKRDLIRQDKEISNKERKRRIRQLEINEQKNKDSEYFSNYGASIFKINL